MTVAGVQNRRTRSHLLCSRLAAKNRVKEATARITTDGEKTRNAAKPVAFAPDWIEKNASAVNQLTILGILLVIWLKLEVRE
jgi:hypothetical protein